MRMDYNMRTTSATTKLEQSIFVTVRTKKGKHKEYVKQIEKKILERPSISSEEDEECVHVTSNGK
jgi:hypothetical protein